LWAILKEVDRVERPRRGVRTTTNAKTGNRDDRVDDHNPGDEPRATVCGKEHRQRADNPVMAGRSFGKEVIQCLRIV